MNCQNFRPIYPEFQPARKHPQPGQNERHSFTYIPTQPVQPAGYMSYAQPQPTYHPMDNAPHHAFPTSYQYLAAPCYGPSNPGVPHQSFGSPTACTDHFPISYPGKTYQHPWLGRTKAQVDEDNQKIAMRTGVWRPNEMAPNKPADDQQFWCVEVDGSHTLRTYAQIEELRPGEWRKDPMFGNAYFVRFHNDIKDE